MKTLAKSFAFGAGITLTCLAVVALIDLAIGGMDVCELEY